MGEPFEDGGVGGEHLGKGVSEAEEGETWGNKVGGWVGG